MRNYLRRARNRALIHLKKARFMSTFNKIILFTDHDGRARFRDEIIELLGGTPQAMLSPELPATGCQLRHSPIGFRSQ